MSDIPRRRGRSARHLDAAERQAAYRERQADAAALGMAARQIVEHPTPALVAAIAARAVGQAADPAAAAQELISAVLAELERLHGHNVAQAARNTLQTKV